MTIRVDSPFYGISEELMDDLMGCADEGFSLEHMCNYYEQQSKKGCSTKQMQRFMARLRLERSLRDGSAEEIEGFAERAKDGKLRDGMIEAARQKLFEEAMETGKSEVLLELYRSAHEERAREREVEVSRRKAAAAEENARIGWKRLELEAARTMAKMLPQLRAVLTDGGLKAEEKVARALAFMPREDGAAGEAKAVLELEAGKGEKNDPKV